MIGYVAGMLTTLGVMSVFQHAQPALLYLVPGVLISLWGTALVRRELRDMWEFSEALTGEQLVEDSEGKEKKDGAKEEKGPKGLFERPWLDLWTGSETQEQPKDVNDELNETSESTKSNDKKQDKERDNEKQKKKHDDTLFSFSVARYNAQTETSTTTDKESAKSEKLSNATHSRSRSESSEDAVVVSSDDLDGAKNSDSGPRYRTRSARS